MGNVWRCWHLQDMDNWCQNAQEERRGSGGDILLRILIGFLTLAFLGWLWALLLFSLFTGLVNGAAYALRDAESCSAEHAPDL